MKIVNQSAQVVLPISDFLGHIERCGRICYKSEEKMTEGSAEKFVRHIVKSGHLSVLEHVRFIIDMGRNDEYWHIRSMNNPYIICTSDIDNGAPIFSKTLVSMSARTIIEEWHKDIHTSIRRRVISDICRTIIAEFPSMAILFGDIALYTEGECKQYTMANIGSMNHYELMKHAYMSVHFVTDRGVTHELVRHRPASYSQESTRYCNYGGKDIGFVPPISIDKVNSTVDFDNFCAMCEVMENWYNNMISSGYSPQVARDILPTCVKTEIVVTATFEQWNHMFDLRLYGKTGAPHPKIKALFELLWNELFSCPYNDVESFSDLAIAGLEDV